ncbi:hypothetical protein [Streptacidiphilus sp. P02-A3a]|uniref:hypothetical protein n=1 Tax=Streptacidiphilus sp. P02-A3a TaxID=2704468 RepID=UPI0015FAF0FE|nr:hypothetical protein [Streptacidiphilus sp. P02-A3a]QMU68027.1 hypothetical protein GXP74_07150 [Streptacidiphilus sp. P02-A3a]
MTAVHLADPREAADLGAFLTRLLRFDKGAAVRLQTANLGLALFARLPLGDSGPLAVRTARLAAEPTGAAAPVDVTLSAGQLLEAVGSGSELELPPAITGPSWAGLLPPRGGWEHLRDLPTAPLRAAVSAAVTEFRRETDDQDALAESIWSRQVDPSGLTLRALHAAQLVGLLQQSDHVAVHRHPAWLRLSAPRGYVIVRRAPAPGNGLGLSPAR